MMTTLFLCRPGHHARTPPWLIRLRRGADKLKVFCWIVERVIRRGQCDVGLDTTRRTRLIVKFLFVCCLCRRWSVSLNDVTKTLTNAGRRLRRRLPGAAVDNDNIGSYLPFISSSSHLVTAKSPQKRGSVTSCWPWGRLRQGRSPQKIGSVGHMALKREPASHWTVICSRWLWHETAIALSTLGHYRRQCGQGHIGCAVHHKALSTLATVVFGDSRRIRRQSPFLATVAVFDDSRCFWRLSPFLDSVDRV